MTSNPILNGQSDPSWPTSPDSCPISSLLGARITEMTDEELDLHVAKMRSARESPQVMRSLLAGKPKKEKSVKTAKKIDLSALGL